MKTKIGIGIISFAHGHANAYCNQMQTFDDVELVACWDDNVERGKAAATQYGMNYSPHLEDVINHPEIHAVIVTCETNRHAEMVAAAASEGKDILCQKPMALTLEDCDRIAAVVEKTGIKFMMGYQMRRDPANIAMKELIDSGVLGKIGVLRRRHCINALFNEGFVTGPSRWHIDPEKNMGMFMDDASHATDFIHWMLGKPTSVIAEIDNILTDVAPDDTGLAVYRFAGGEMAILLNTSVTLAGENTTEYPTSCRCCCPQVVYARRTLVERLGYPNSGWSRRTDWRRAASVYRLPEERDRTRCHGSGWTGFSGDGARCVSFGTRGTACGVSALKSVTFFSRNL